MGLPPTIKRMTHVVPELWMTGSSATLGFSPGRDIDIIVPSRYWHLAAQFIPSFAEPNTHGGWKWAENPTLIDMWPDDIGRILCMDRHHGDMVCLVSGVRIRKVEE